ncbi:enoyl-CoA hydratase/isomerase family protein [Peribacillus alkalitolerans]|uniref:enoyl-CoA hydratase/isomerase family protein n=1 Tax=Peribacillus alkalitolerans TaxID=1550385 RepID=UPI0013D3F8C6|nr:enoyl-CoA hydratase/isomerase family protein [Peribacillus alkalitolerans]
MLEQSLLKHLSKDGILKLTIHRPEKRNAINYQIMDELASVLLEARENKNIKTVVIIGEGNRAFCSGGDLSEFHRLHTATDAYEMLSKMGEVLYSLLTLPIPTIAILNGTAVGGGCEIASACDFRWAYPQVKVGFIQGNQGITTGWGGGTILLEKLLPSNALKMLLSAKVLLPEEAKQLGFIDQVLNEKDHWESLVANMIEKEQEVLVAYKQILIRKWKETNIKERIDQEIRECANLWESDAHLQAVAKFTGKKI